MDPSNSLKAVRLGMILAAVGGLLWGSPPTMAQSKMIGLGTLGGKESSSTGINESGQVIGESYRAGPFLSSHAFLYRAGKMVDLGTRGGRNSSAQGINASGQVVGSAQTADGHLRAFIYSGGKMIDLFGAFGGPSNSALTNHWW